KLLLDPYAKAIEGDIDWNEALLNYVPGDEDRMSTADSAQFMPRCIVHDPVFEWGGDRPLGIPLHASVIYEAHVQGRTARHPGSPELHRGTYAGLADPVIIDHLTRLGVTAVELLPVHQFVHDGFLVERGLRNYWGYNTIGFFVPHHEYSTRRGGQQVAEFKS